ncbi:hypothetical protein MRX96_047086 [Rhipicephalus microplus]
MQVDESRHPVRKAVRDGKTDAKTRCRTYWCPLGLEKYRQRQNIPAADSQRDSVSAAGRERRVKPENPFLGIRRHHFRQKKSGTRHTVDYCPASTGSVSCRLFLSGQIWPGMYEDEGSGCATLLTRTPRNDGTERASHEAENYKAT